jgi:hypothetical protein
LDKLERLITENRTCTMRSILDNNDSNIKSFTMDVLEASL